MAIGDAQIIATDQVVLGKIESSYGVDPTIAAADGILVDRIVAPAMGFEVHEKKVADGSTSRRQSHRGARWWDYALAIALRGSGVVDTAPKIGRLLQASGMGETVNGSTDVTYATQKLAKTQKSIALEGHLNDDHHFQALGSRGPFSLSGEGIGQPVMFQFPMRGIYAAPANAASPGSEVYDSQQAPVFMDGTFAIFGGAFKLKSFQINANTAMAERRYHGAAHGVGGVVLTGWDPTGQVVLELDSLADKDWFAHVLAGTTGAFDLTVGSVAGNKFDIDVPVCAVNGPPVITEDAGLAIVTLPLEFLGTGGAGDDWLTVKHY